MISKFLQVAAYRLQVAGCGLRVASLILVFFLFSVYTSESQVVIEHTIDIQIEDIYADNFDNIYVLTDNNFIKYNSKGEKIAYFNSEGGEETAYADVRNSFKIIVFYKQLNKIIVLDNKLTKISDDISLDNLELFGDVLITGATIGGYWIFDKQNNQLLKLNSDFKTEYKKDLDIQDNIISITDNAEYVIFQENNMRAFIGYNFNSGELKNLGVDKANENYRVIGDIIVYYSGNLHGLRLFNVKTNTSKYITLPKKINITNAVYGNNKIFFYNDDKVYICSFKK